MRFDSTDLSVAPEPPCFYSHFSVSHRKRLMEVPKYQEKESTDTLNSKLFLNLEPIC